MKRQRFFEFFVNFAFGAIFAFSIVLAIYIFLAFLPHGLLAAILSAIFAFFVGSLPLLFLETYMTLQELKGDSKKQGELLQELVENLEKRNLNKDEPVQIPHN